MGPWGKRDDVRVHETEPYNAEPPPAALAGQWLTPVDAFYSRNHGPVPRIAPDTWRLRVDGLVQRPLDLSLADLRDGFEAHSAVVTLQCAGNRRAGLIAVRDIPGEDPWGSAAVSTAEWTGARLGDVLAAAGVQEGAAHVALEAPDVSELADPPQRFGASVPLEKAGADEVLLAWAMNGEPVPPVHGGPVRVVVPGWIGARSVKWIERVTVQREPSDNWFQDVAYRLLPSDGEPAHGRGIPLGPLPLTADILAPEDGAVVSAGPLEVTGYALAGDRRTVARVEVSADGGASWRAAKLDPPIGPWAWQHWRATLAVPPGPAELVARAWDSAGTPQPELPGPLWNPKGYANNSWGRVTLTARH